MIPARIGNNQRESSKNLWFSKTTVYIQVWAVTRDFQQCGNLTSVDSDEPVQPLFKLRNLKWGLVSSLTVIEYLSGQQRLWSACAYTQAGLSLCWSHIPHCWKSHAMAHIFQVSFTRCNQVTRSDLYLNYIFSIFFILFSFIWLCFLFPNIVFV